MRLMLRASNCWARLRCAALFLATTSRPEVSLSSRCRMPGRKGPVHVRQAFEFEARALARVPEWMPLPGWVTMPLGLSTTRMCSSS